MDAKRCSDCRETKPLADFCKNRSHSDGLANVCRPCHSVRNRVWNDSTPRRQLSISLRRALVRRPTESPATVAHLMDLWECQGGQCALSALPMVYRQGRVMGQSISIDRIDQSRGYETGNLRLICHAVNCFRGNMNDEQMLEIARALVLRSTEWLHVEGQTIAPVKREPAMAA